MNKKTFLGFGLGAVQSGLMLYEAFKSNNFDRLVIIEVNSEVVDAVKKAGNKIWVNTATKSSVIKTIISDFEIYNPNNSNDYNALVAAIHQADEMATAVPSTDFYDRGKNSIAKLLAENINPDKYQILYTVENNNYAAEILHNKIKQYASEEKIKNFQAMNTVVGKMGGVINDEVIVKELDLDWMTPHSKVAILVEEFNDIIITKNNLAGFERGIKIFREKDNLLPFEEAKLFGHNAIHSMLGYLAFLKDYNYMSDIRSDAKLYAYGQEAFENESGKFLLKKYKDNDDALFTKEGFKFYGRDLMERITNPYLHDEVKRICRDPLRKLQYEDRFFGTIRESFKQDVHPKIMAKAVLGGICYVIHNKIEVKPSYPERIEDINEQNVKAILQGIWGKKQEDDLEDMCLDLICSELEEFQKEFLFSPKVVN